MKLGIMKPYLFPYLGYWQLINIVDKYVIYDDVNFIKNGWINRNNILLNGQKHLITLPLDGASPFDKINEIKITSNAKQKEKLLKTIISAYKKAPYFEEVYSIVEKTIMYDTLYISQAIAFSIKEIAKYLTIDTEILTSSTINKQNELKAQDKVIDIAKSLGATQYINAIGGQNLYNKGDFLNENITLNFIKMNDIKYQQFGKEDFVENLSIIDVLMFNSTATVKEMLNEYKLI